MSYYAKSSLNQISMFMSGKGYKNVFKKLELKIICQNLSYSAK